MQLLQTLCGHTECAPKRPSLARRAPGCPSQPPPVLACPWRPCAWGGEGGSSARPPGGLSSSSGPRVAWQSPGLVRGPWLARATLSVCFIAIPSRRVPVAGSASAASRGGGH